MPDLSTSAKTSGVPLRKNQPGLGRTANTPPAIANLGPVTTRPVSRIENYDTRRAERIAARS